MVQSNNDIKWDHFCLKRENLENIFFPTSIFRKIANPNVMWGWAGGHVVDILIETPWCARRREEVIDKREYFTPRTTDGCYVFRLRANCAMQKSIVLPDLYV